MALSKVMALAACRCQPLPLPVLVDWIADPMGVRIPADGVKEQNEDNLKAFVC